MSLVEHRVLVDVLVVGISSRSSSGSTMGSELDCCLVRAGIFSVVERWVGCSVGEEMEGFWVGSLVGALDGL